MWTIVSHCPKCGAPIYVPMIWHGVIPPPPEYSCTCFTLRGQQTVLTTKTGA